MKLIDLEGKTKEELSAQLQELREKLVQLKFSLAGNKLKDLSQIGKTKRDVARIMTALRK